MLQADLEHLERADLIRRAQFISEREYWFKHVLVQETTYEALLKQDRKRLHRFVAQALERARNADDVAPLLARHWDRAGETERAFGYYTRAARNAARVHANVEAQMTYERARVLARELDLTDAQLLELYVERGRVFELRDLYEQARENYEELQTVGAARRAARLQLEGLAQLAKLYATPNNLFDLARAEGLALNALDMARDLADRPTVAKVLWNLLLIKHFAGQRQEAIGFGEASLAIARELDLREQLAYTLNDIMRPYATTGQMAKARAAWEEADALWRELNNLPMRADNLTNACLYAFFRGDTAAGIAMAQEGLAITEQISNAWGQAYALSFLGMMYYIMGELARAREFLKRGAELGLQARALETTANGHIFLGLIYRLMGLPERGIALLEEALRIDWTPPAFARGIYGTLTILLVEQGDLARGQETYAHAQKFFNSNLDSSAPPLVGFAGVMVALAENRAADARAQAEDLARVLDAVGILPFKALADFLRARAEAEMGMFEMALETLEGARRVVSEMKARTIEWEIVVMMARLHAQLGQRETAEARKREARQLTAFLAEHAPMEMREAFLQRSDVRALMGDDHRSK